MEGYKDSRKLSATKSETTDLKRLLQYLDEIGRTLNSQELSELLRTIEISENQLTDWIVYDDKIYSRNRIAIYKNVEILVMCWKSGQMSPIHNHKGSACSIKVIKGIATEISYSYSKSGKLIPRQSVYAKAGEVLDSNDQEIHQMGNTEELGKNLVTLHCYSPPLTGADLFDQSAAYFSDYDSLIEKSSKRLKPAADC